SLTGAGLDLAWRNWQAAFDTMVSALPGQIVEAVMVGDAVQRLREVISDHLETVDPAQVPAPDQVAWLEQKYQRVLELAIPNDPDAGRAGRGRGGGGAGGPRRPGGAGARPAGAGRRDGRGDDRRDADGGDRHRAGHRYRIGHGRVGHGDRAKLGPGRGTGRY